MNPSSTGGGQADPQDGNRVLIPTHGAEPRRPPSHEIWDLGGETMGTTWSVRLCPPPGADRQAIAAAIQAELDRVILLFSPWEPRSEVSRFNGAPEGLYAVSAPFWTFLNACMDLADQTDGTVDPTLGALVNLWGFGPPGPRPLDPATQSPIAPTQAEIDAARQLSGWNRLRLSLKTQAVTQMGGMRLDFSALAKGYAVDQISALLSDDGIASHLVEIGGELRGANVRPDGYPWWVEIAAPDGLKQPRTVAALFDMAVATSGDDVRFWQTDRGRFGHTLDRRTGRPIDNGMVSVTVFDPSAFRADALTTAFMVMGRDMAPSYAEMDAIPARMIWRDEGGTLHEHLSPALQAMLDEGEDRAT